MSSNDRARWYWAAPRDVPTIPGLILLRHGEVASHRGDVPLTPQGRGQAERAGRRLARQHDAGVWILVGPTLRAQQTGMIMLRALMNTNSSGRVAGPTVTPALRNPDLYLAGHRVEMVSTAAAFAHQVPRFTEAQVTSIPFYSDFLTSADRIGCWLHHPDPPGDTAAIVASRIRQFAASLGHVDGVGQVVGITHSPVLRAMGSHFGGSDPGEPDYLHGYSVQVRGDGAIALDSVDWKQADRA
jgi:broad specificity phosphatase PhoE